MSGIEGENYQQPAGPRQSAASLKAQIEEFDLLYSKDLYEEITPERFPDLSPERVALARFWAMDNRIYGLQNAYHTALDLVLREQLARRITQLIIDRDAALLLTIGQIDGAVDDALITAQAMFRQPVDFTRAMEMAMGIGLPNQLNPYNFPALRALTTKDRTYIELQAVRNRRDHLESFRSALKTTGISRKEEGSEEANRRSGLAEEIEELDRLSRQLLDQYLSSK